MEERKRNKNRNLFIINLEMQTGRRRRRRRKKRRNLRRKRKLVFCWLGKNIRVAGKLNHPQFFLSSFFLVFSFHFFDYSSRFSGKLL